MVKALKITALGIFVFLAFSQTAMSREFADIYSECGLGAMIAPKNTGVAAVTNVLWDSGTTAISSNISSPDTCKGGQGKVASLINQSYESLAKDLASGKGEYLTALTTLSGADPVALRKEFAKAVAEPGYSAKSQYAKAESLYNLVYKNS